MKSSSALLAIINDILDLASIDADAMELSLEDVDIAQTMRAAAEGVQDRLGESSLTLRVAAMEGLGSFIADGKRIRQILFNLLSTRSAFPRPVIPSISRRRGGTARSYSPFPTREAEFRPKSSNMFSTASRPIQQDRAIAALALAFPLYVPLSSLHGGCVEIDSTPGKGTRATCIFPAQGMKLVASETPQGM